MSAAAVEVHDLQRRYGATVAVAGLSLEAPTGAVTAILGRNGAGKTTTVEICAGLRRADAGHVRVLGRDPRRDAADLRTRVGVMPQTGGSGAAGIYPSARPTEVLRLYSSFYPHPHDPTALLDRVGLTDAARTPWRRLSGGEQQRLSLALAIVGRPELVFLDEPTAGLDVHARHATWDLVDELRNAGVTVILTTHAMDEAERLADQVVVVDHGKVVAAGSPSTLAGAATASAVTFDAPAGLPVADLAATLPPGIDVIEQRPGHYVVTGPVDPALVAAITAWCASRGILPERVTTVGRSLEDVFLQLTQEHSR